MKSFLVMRSVGLSLLLLLCSCSILLDSTSIANALSPAPDFCGTGDSLPPNWINQIHALGGNYSLFNPDVDSYVSYQTGLDQTNHDIEMQINSAAPAAAPFSSPSSIDGANVYDPVALINPGGTLAFASVGTGDSTNPRDWSEAFSFSSTTLLSNTSISSSYAQDFISYTSGATCLAKYGNNVGVDSTYSAVYDTPVFADGKPSLYPTMTFSTDIHNNVTLAYDPQMQKIYDVPVPNYIILTLTDNSGNIILPSNSVEGIANYNLLSNATYIVHEDVAYIDPAINARFDFKDTEFKVVLSGTAFSIIYDNGASGYCSISNPSGPTSLLSTTPTTSGSNCTISQPEDMTHAPIDGTPTGYTPETCDITHIQGCLDDFFYAAGNYFGLNAAPASNAIFNFGTGTFGLTAIITYPIAILTSIGEGTYTCSAVSLPVPFTSGSLSLPCLTPIYEANFGTIFTIYQTIVFGVVAYFVWVSILKTVKDFKDPKKDQIEVLQL